MGNLILSAMGILLVGIGVWFGAKKKWTVLINLYRQRGTTIDQLQQRIEELEADLLCGKNRERKLQSELKKRKVEYAHNKKEKYA